jgi:hypothetical protein
MISVPSPATYAGSLGSRLARARAPFLHATHSDVSLLRKKNGIGEGFECLFVVYRPRCLAMLSFGSVVMFCCPISSHFHLHSLSFPFFEFFWLRVTFVWVHQQKVVIIRCESLWRQKVVGTTTNSWLDLQRARFCYNRMRNMVRPKKGKRVHLNEA